MNLHSGRKMIGGISVCADPAREPCFTIAKNGSEMFEFEDTMSMPARRERLHRHMNNEVGSMEIAAQMLVDFPDVPWDLRMQLARQAYDESRHVQGLFRRLLELGGRKGEFPISNLEWAITNTQDNIPARLAIQNRTFEAGQMDLLGGLRAVWRAAGDDKTATLLDDILADEVNHVRFANRWIKKFVKENGGVLLKIAVGIRFLSSVLAADRDDAGDSHDGTGSRGHANLGINVDDRRNAEFSADEINEILRQGGMGSLAEAGISRPT